MPRRKRQSPQRLPKWQYYDYINSVAWEAKKKKYRQSNLPQGCLVCGSKKVDLHHRTYKRLGNEWLNDLVPLCREHHRGVHRFQKKHGLNLWGATKLYIRSRTNA